MEYITHHRMRGKTACGQEMNIPYGTKFQTIGKFIATADGRAICYTTSEMAHEFFARNDDGRGLERGAFTYAIAYKQRDRKSDDGHRVQRFTDAEIATLEEKWDKYLVQDVPVILFNDDFFNAEPEELRLIAESVNIKVDWEE